MKQNKDINNIELFQKEIRNTAYADGNKVSLLTQVFNKLSQVSGLKLSKSKWEIAPTGILKRV